MQHRHAVTRVIAVSLLSVALGSACSGAATRPDVGPTSAATRAPLATPTAEATSAPVPVPAAPAPTPDPRQQAFGLHAPLPLAGEFAVTANLDDHTLSVVPIGAAAVATTVQLDVAPSAVGAFANSDAVLAADGAPASHAIATASLNASSETGTIDLGGRPDEVAAPPPGADGPALVISDEDNSVRSVDSSTHARGSPLKIGMGPHSVSVARGSAMLAPAVLIANAGEGSVSVLDQKATVVQSTLDVGGTPVGVARTVDGRIWVADASSGSAVMFDAESGRRLQTITVAPHLTGLAATPDGHYLALASSDPRYCGRDGRGAGDR
jgi:DNA-binding beta-propeller fold protein YncE